MTYVTIGRWLTTDETFKNAVAEAELEVYYHWPIGNCVFSKKKLRLPSRVFCSMKNIKSLAFLSNFPPPFFSLLRCELLVSPPLLSHVMRHETKTKVDFFVPRGIYY
jgi:hypothetical protein